MIENPAKTIEDKPIINSAIDLNERAGAYLVSFAVLSERFSFWGLQAIMVLFLMHVFSQSKQNAFILIGAFGALSYSLSVVGGFLSDKLLGAWRSCEFGLFLCLLGNTILIFSHEMIYLYAGLACILVGAGLFSPSSNKLIGLLYEKRTDLKESGFLIMCVAGNMSGALAPLIYGLFGDHNHWNYAFCVSVLLNCISLLFFFKYSNNFRLYDDQTYPRKNVYFGKIALLIFIAVSFCLLLYRDWLNTVLLCTIVPLSYFIFRLYFQLTFQERKRICFIFSLTIILMLFYIAVFQIYSSMTIFVEQYVNKNIMGLFIPAPAFASLQCIFFILCAPIVDKVLAFARQKGYTFSLLAKIPIGLIIGSIGFLLFALGEKSAYEFGSCEMKWIIAGNFFLGLDEVILYPPILTAISSFSPKRLTGTFMGIFSLSLALASYFSGQVAQNITDSVIINIKHNTSFFNLIYAKVSMVITGVAIVSSVIFYRIHRWYHEQEKDVSG